MIIEVIVVDDHATIRLGVRLLLKNTPDMCIVGEAQCGIEALELVSDLTPDILLLDVRLPDISGPQVCAQIQELHLRTKVLGFSAFSNNDYIIKMLDAGAKGYVLKTESPDTLLGAIRIIAGGETWLSPTIANNLFTGVRRELVNYSTLSQRELEVLRVLARGQSNIQIAKTLLISRATVKNHLANIYNKLGVRSRAEAISWAWSNGLIKKSFPGNK